MTQLDPARFEKAFEAYSEAENTLKGIEAAIRAYVGTGDPTKCAGDIVDRLLNLVRVMESMDGRTMCIRCEDGFIDDGVFVAGDHLPTAHEAIRALAAPTVSLEPAAKIWSEFVAACENREDYTYDKPPANEYERGFRAGERDSAKYIRLSVEHPKYRHDMDEHQPQRNSTSPTQEQIAKLIRSHCSVRVHGEDHPVRDGVDSAASAISELIRKVAP